jgi:hypothetical protein
MPAIIVSSRCRTASSRFASSRVRQAVIRSPPPPMPPFAPIDCSMFSVSWRIGVPRLMFGIATDSNESLPVV